MSHEVIVENEEVLRTAPVDVRPQEVLNGIVASIRRDSQQAAETFLAETTVPHGGE